MVVMSKIGTELAKKYKEHPVIVNAIASHHGDVEANKVRLQSAHCRWPVTPSSAPRPGSRRESMEVLH